MLMVSAHGKRGHRNIEDSRILEAVVDRVEKNHDLRSFIYPYIYRSLVCGRCTEWYAKKSSLVLP